MSFLKNLFAVKDDKEGASKYNLRECKFKNEQYFLSELTRIDKWQDTFNEDDKQYLLTHNNLLRSHYSSKFSLHFQRVEVMYSLGMPITNIQTEFIKSLPNFFKGWGENDEAYADMVNAISLSVLLDVPKNYFDEFVILLNKINSRNFKEIWKPDAFLDILLSYKIKDREISKDLIDAAKYQKLVDIFSKENDEAEEMIKEYLKDWYNLNEDMPWFDIHKRQWGFSGYWAWNVAALIRVKKLTEINFKFIPYYPSDML
jgi:hypothetical protein